MRSSKLLQGSAALVAATFVCWAGGIRLNLTGSMPVGVYRVVQGRPSHGAMVLACIPTSIARFAHERGYVPNGNCPSGVAAVGKSILALYRDTVVLTVEGIRIAGSLLPNSKPLRRDSEGRPLPQLALGVYVVRPDEMWLLSTYFERSFDSRYFGPVPTTAIVAIITPLFAPP
jgi:conjugative transfer signal peptidase TraF